MSKEYFPHDYGARLSLRGIRKDFGLQGLGFYWCFVEILHEEGGYIKESDLDNIAYDLQVAPELCYAVTHNYDLFTVKKGKIFSERVLRNIKKRTEISAARSNAANTRWQNALITQKTVALATENDSCIKNEREQIDHYLQLWDKEEPGTDPFIKTPAETVRQSLDALIAVIGNKKNLKINGNDVSMQEWLHAIVGCVQDARRRYYIYSIFCEVDERAEMGAIKNKSKYLATAIYNAAKMSGE